MSQMAAQPESLRYRQLLKVLNKALDASVDADQTLPVIHGCFRGLPKSGKARFDLLCRSMLRELRKNIEVGCVCVCARGVRARHRVRRPEHARLSPLISLFSPPPLPTHRASSA